MPSFADNKDVALSRSNVIASKGSAQLSLGGGLQVVAFQRHRVAFLLSSPEFLIQENVIRLRHILFVGGVSGRTPPPPGASVGLAVWWLPFVLGLK